MGIQDGIVAVYLSLLLVTIVRGITGPRHLQTHGLLIVSALFVPFISFDLARLGELPGVAWGLCAAFVGAQILHTAFHVWRPEAPHRDGPEILMQPLLVVWAVGVRQQVPADLWYRGDLGVFLFCVAVIFVSLAVLMVIYMGGLTQHAGDEIDFRAYTLKSPSNAGFIVASGTATCITLYVTFGSAWWLLAAMVAFVGLRLLLPPEPVSVAR